jgi:hypothetical protein
VRGCHGGWATYGNYVADANLKIHQFTAQYHTGRIINNEWVTHRTGMHHLFRVDGSVHDPAGHALVTAYAVRRPDGDWALLLVNKDRDHPHKIEIVFEGAGGQTSFFDGEATMVTFGGEQYVWHSAGERSHAEPDNPPVASRIEAGRGAVVTLPKCSATVLRGKVQGLA